MSVKEENEKLVAENARLVKTNADISASINASKLALEEAQAQELAGKSILVNFAREIENAQNSLEVAKKVLSEANAGVERLESRKTELEQDIEKAQKDTTELYWEEKSKHEAELKNITAAIEVKRNELTELLSKIKAENINLTVIKGEISLLDVELSKTQAIYDDVVAKCKAKDEELNALNNEYSHTTSAITKAKQVLKDTEISTESYEDRKAGLITEIGTLNDEINTAKATITSINTEIVDLEAKKAEKDAEYNGSVSKIFDLLRREEAVAEREEYAKSRFKDAGLEY